MVEFHTAYKLLDNENKQKVNKWAICKKIYKNIEILLYNTNNFNDFNAIKQLNYFYKDVYDITEYIENNYDVHIEYNNKIYVWSIHDDFEECDFYDMNILNKLNNNELFICCCQIFLYYYNMTNYKKLQQFYKIDFYYNNTYQSSKLHIYKNKKTKYNDNYIYTIEWIEINTKNNFNIHKKINNYNNLSKYDDNCILFILLCEHLN